VDICLFGNIKQKNLDEHLLKHRTGIDKEHMKNVDITKSNLGVSDPVIFIICLFTI
jgi:hypothetical protein